MQPDAPPEARIYLGEHTLGEEIAHAVTHGVGALLSLAGLVVLVVAAATIGSAVHVVGCAVFGATLSLLYLASTLYHAMPARLARAKRVLQRCDHGAIYLLIAGTYTPFTLFTLPEPWGMRLFLLIWGLAVVGLYVTVRSLMRPDTTSSMRRYERLSLVLYLAMGWAVLLAAKPLVESLPAFNFGLMLAGGIAYTAGVAFFVQQKKWMHSVWHGFVMAGSGLHFAAVLVTVAR
ncbi:MAG: hemolysin III family protein [Deltaproteobacteria bacterium]|nr:hemolysin III family protein [Deltaproteobacteria bacterium]